MKLLLISGSAAKKSHTTTMIEYIAEIAKKQGIESRIWKLADRPLPTSQPHWHHDPQNVNDPTVSEFARAIADADALVLGSPLYHGSYSGILKNALDCLGSDNFRGKKVGIIGLGHIGLAIAERCAGLGMEVTYWSRSLKQVDYKFVELDQLMAESDVIFPAMELNEDTSKILTDSLMRSMKSSAIFISVVHELFNQDLLLSMVKKGKLFGYGFEAEPSSFDKYQGNVWAAPAYAWATKETMDNAYVLLVDNLVNAAMGNFPNRIN